MPFECFLRLIRLFGFKGFSHCKDRGPEIASIESWGSVNNFNNKVQCGSGIWRRGEIGKGCNYSSDGDYA